MAGNQEQPQQQRNHAHFNEHDRNGNENDDDHAPHPNHDGVPAELTGFSGGQHEGGQSEDGLPACHIPMQSRHPQPQQISQRSGVAPIIIDHNEVGCPGVNYPQPFLEHQALLQLASNVDDAHQRLANSHGGYDHPITVQNNDSHRQGYWNANYNLNDANRVYEGLQTPLFQPAFTNKLNRQPH